MITVELYGIPRVRAGVPAVAVMGQRLGEVLIAIAERFPSLGDTCLTGDRLRPGYVANLNGQRFVTDPSTPLAAGDCVLIMSADAGG